MYFVIMALVPVVDRRTAGLAALLYNTYNNYRNVRPYVNQAMALGKRMYRQAFGQARSRPRTYKKPRYSRPRPSRRRFRRSYRRRRPFFRIRRGKGRRGYGNQYLTIRNNYHLRKQFDQDVQGDFKPLVIEMDEPYLWFPPEDQIDRRVQYTFDNAISKKLVSVHVYMKNLHYQEVSQSSPPYISSNDNKIYTFADPGSADLNQVVIDNHYMATNGVPAKLTRMSKKYHSILKCYTGAQKVTTETCAILGQRKWKDISQEYEFFNRTGFTDPGSTRLNIDWCIVPEVVSCEMGGITGCLKGEIVVATKWRLYSSLPGR